MTHEPHFNVRRAGWIWGFHDAAGNWTAVSEHAFETKEDAIADLNGSDARRDNRTAEIRISDS